MSCNRGKFSQTTCPTATRNSPSQPGPLLLGHPPAQQPSLTPPSERSPDLKSYAADDLDWEKFSGGVMGLSKV